MMLAYGTTRTAVFGGFVLHLFNDAASNVVRVDGHEGLMILKQPFVTILNQCLLIQLRARGGALG